MPTVGGVFDLGKKDQTAWNWRLDQTRTGKSLWWMTIKETRLKAASTFLSSLVFRPGCAAFSILGEGGQTSSLPRTMSMARGMLLTLVGGSSPLSWSTQPLKSSASSLWSWHLPRPLTRWDSSLTGPSCQPILLGAPQPHGAGWWQPGRGWWGHPAQAGAAAKRSRTERRWAARGGWWLAWESWRLTHKLGVLAPLEMCKRNLVPTQVLGVHLGCPIFACLSRLTLCSKKTEHPSHLPGGCRALPPTNGAQSTPSLKGLSKAFPSLGLVRSPLHSQWKEVFPRCFSLFNYGNSSLLWELSVVINSVPFCFKIGLRKMPGCLIFKLDV